MKSAEGQHSAAQRGGDFRRSHGNALVGALYRDAETQFSLRVFRRFTRRLRKRSADFGKILVGTHRHLVRNRQGMYPEHAGEALQDFTAIVLIEILDEISPLRPLESAIHALQGGLYVPDEQGLEIISVFSFEEQLPVSDYNDFFHNAPAARAANVSVFAFSACGFGVRLRACAENMPL